MTENQWPQDGGYTSPPATEQTPGVPTSGPGTAPGYAPGPGSSPGYAPGADDTLTQGRPTQDRPTQERVRDEAGNVADQAADSATSVMETAKEEAATVASEVSANAKDLLVQAKADLTEQAAAQQQKVAAGLRSISEELRSMASASKEPGVATDLVRQAAERSSSVASWLDNRDPGSLLDEVKSFARQRPGTFLLLAAGAGVLAGRVTRGLSAGGDASNGTPGYASRNRMTPPAHAPAVGEAASGRYAPAAGMAVPPPPVQLPGPEVTTAGYAGDTAAAGYAEGGYAGENPAGGYAGANPTGGYAGANPAGGYAGANPAGGYAEDGTPEDGHVGDTAEPGEPEYPYGMGPDAGGQR